MRIKTQTSNTVNLIFARVHDTNTHIKFMIFPSFQASSYGLNDNSFRFGSLTVMPNALVDFYKPESLTQSLKLDISDKLHIFPGGMVSSQMVDVRARNITIEVAGSIVTKSSGFISGTGKGIVKNNFLTFRATNLNTARRTDLGN